MEHIKTTIHDLDRIREICERVGLKLTHQRLEIFKELVTATGHLSAEDVFERLQKRIPTLSKDTVYRTLARFAELGIARKLHLANNKTLFDTNTAPHHHFICDTCRRVADIYWPEFDQTAIPAELGVLGRIESRHLELHGICRSCLDRHKDE